MSSTVPVGVPEEILEVERNLIAPGGPFELEEDEVLGERLLVFKNRVRSLPEVVRNSVAFGDREYLVFTDGTTTRRITFAEHAQLVASTAKVFAERYGVGPGDRVAILAANTPEWIVAFWATVSLGGIAVGLNGWSMGPEIEYFLEDSEPKVFVVDRKRLERLEGKDPGVPTLVIEDDFEAVWRAHPDAELPAHEAQEDDPAIILYTSGTTGRPKGALASHRNLASFLSLSFYQGLRSMMIHPGPADAPPASSFMTSPLFHVSGLHAAAVTFLATGTRSVWWIGRFDPVGAARAMQDEQCTGWSITETVLHRFVNHPDIASGRFDLSNIRTVGGGGSPIPPALIRQTRAVFPNASRSMGLGYGLTECAALATINNGVELEQFPSAAGRALPTVQVEVRDPDTHEPLPEGAEGEVWIRSPGVMLEYWRKPEATAETIMPGRWLRTGDVGYFEGGRLFLASRKRDMILRGGENVYPIEIEQRLTEHPDVAEAAVVGVDDAEYGQAVKAIVVPKPGRTLDPADLQAFVAKALAPYKVPGHWEVRTDALPRNASGKVLKDQLQGDAVQRFVEE